MVKGLLRMASIEGRGPALVVSGVFSFTTRLQEVADFILPITTRLLQIDQNITVDETLAPTVEPTVGFETGEPTKPAGFETYDPTEPEGFETDDPIPPPTDPPVRLEPPTLSPVSQQKNIVQGITVIFGQTNKIPAGSTETFGLVLGDWFNAFYADNDGGYRGLRNLQATALVRNMDNFIDITKQDVDPDYWTNAVTFSQMLEYEALAGAPDPEDLVLAPWNDAAYTEQLANSLSQEIPSAFANVMSPISPPVIVNVFDDVNTGGGSSGDNTKPAGLYALMAIVLVPIAAITFLMYRKCKRPPQQISDGREHSTSQTQQDPATLSSAPKPTASAGRHQHQQQGKHPPVNKDQPRIVAPPDGSPGTIPVSSSNIQQVDAPRPARHPDPPAAMADTYLPDYKDQHRTAPRETRGTTGDTPMAYAIALDDSMTLSKAEDEA